MRPRAHKHCFTLLLSLYLLTSQATVLVTVLQWYSTAAHQAVDMRAGALQEQGELRWSPRTHLPPTSQSEHSPTEPARSAGFPVFRSLEGLPLESPRLLTRSEYFALLSNKAPPLA